MSFRPRSFWTAFFLTLLAFFILNLLAAHFMSDCGLPAVLGMAGCADDIVRAGFPLQFYEEGGFAYHRNFIPAFFITDLSIACGVALMLGLFYQHRQDGKRAPQ